MISAQNFVKTFKLAVDATDIGSGFVDLQEETKDIESQVFLLFKDV